MDSIRSKQSEMFRDPGFFRTFRERVIPILRTYPLLNLWHSGCATGEEADSTAILLGVTGVHHETGLTTGDPDEAAMKRALAARAGDTYVLASSEKIGAASPFTVLPLASVSGIITDAPPDHPVLDALRRAGTSVMTGND